MERCQREIRALEALPLDHPEALGILMALTDWHVEMLLNEEKPSGRAGGQGSEAG